MATAEEEVEETTSDGEWVVVEDPNWVLVKLNENHDDDGYNRDKGHDGFDDYDHHAGYVDQGKVEEDADAAEDKEDSEDHNEHRIKDNTETYEDGDDDVNDTRGFSEDVCNDGDGAHGFLDDEDVNSCSDDKAAHGFSAGACEDEEDDDADEDYDSYIDALHDVALQDEDAHRCSDDEDDDDDDNQDYEIQIDDMTERALRYEADKRGDSRIDAEDRYYTDPVGEGWQEYMCSLQTQTRKELHATKMMSFCGYGPDPVPFMEDSQCFNPLFESMWLPWAMEAEYCHNEDMGLFVCEAGAMGLMLGQLAIKQYMSSAVPIRPLLECMVNNAPGKRIAHIGSCSSLYWAALLQHLGAENVIVTEGPLAVPFADEAFSSIDQIGEEMFFLCNMAGRQALFFLRPSKRSTDAEPCLAERCLFCFSGDTVFFVGETGEHADNFDMVQWVEEHKLEGWCVQREMEIPCWPGSHDVFLWITKADMSIDNTA